MTAPARLRLPGWALGSLGLLVLAAVLALTGAARTADRPAPDSRGVQAGSVVVDRAAEPSVSESHEDAAVDESVSGASTARGPDAGLLRKHIRSAVGAVLLTPLPGGSQPHWLTVLGLGLALRAAADRGKLQALCPGSRHGTRAPPACS